MCVYFSHKCPDCEEEFTSKAKLQVHSKLHSSQGKDLLKCSVQVYTCREIRSYASNFEVTELKTLSELFLLPNTMKNLVLILNLLNTPPGCKRSAVPCDCFRPSRMGEGLLLKASSLNIAML